ncbi:hypothetical protein BD779DRAFT_1675893 [Infundibulicybe gibba]|nr:hypothetical protein BD779DRAFT_1675893 [Infundibulicybe gibba]
MNSTCSVPAYDFYTTSYPPFNAPAYMYVAAILFETLLYGIYIVLFFICVHILLRNKRTLQLPLLVLAILMFSIATADIGVTYAYLLRYILRGEIAPFTYVYPKFILFVTNNVLADTLVIYRCYAVWSHNKRIIIFPCILLLAATICGYGATSHSLKRSFGIYLWMTFTLNILVTTLTAGRIWWISQKARRILGSDLVKRYNSAIAVIVESGAIYSSYIIHVILSVLVLDVGLIQMVGIVPTLIIVQVGLGRDTVERPTTISTMQPEPRGSVALDTALSRDGGVSRPSSVLDIRLAPVLRPERDVRRWGTNDPTVENAGCSDIHV